MSDASAAPFSLLVGEPDAACADGVCAAPQPVGSLDAAASDGEPASRG